MNGVEFMLEIITRWQCIGFKMVQINCSNIPFHLGDTAIYYYVFSTVFTLNNPAYPVANMALTNYIAKVKCLNEAG